MTRGCRINVVFVVALLFLLLEAEIGKVVGSGPATFDVTKFGAIGDGKPHASEEGDLINTFGIMRAWQKACNSIGPSKVVIPKGTFVVEQTMLSGPCQSSVTVELEGIITPNPDTSFFPNQVLIVFNNVEGASLIGPGTIKTSQTTRTPGDPEEEIVFMSIMPSISILGNCSNFVLDGIHSFNPFAFHVLIDSSHNVTIRNANFDTDSVEPKTHSNAIYISSSTLVTVTNSFIRTGDDCITISGGSSNVSVTGVTCADGQGISIGAQPMTTPEADVKGVRVRNCTFKGASFGARINPRPHAKPGQIADIIFEDLVMEQAQNPIIINQDYPPKPSKPSYAKIVDVHFKNIRGTTTTNKAVDISCNKMSPCDTIEVADINLSFGGSGKDTGLSAVCTNAKVTFAGKHDGLSCM